MNKIVLGLGFGDEGKGLITDYLCSPKSIVVRFSGGHQAGHTVVRNGKRHIFSNYGSGTSKGCKTFWSKYCTFHPTGVINEYQEIKEFEPKLFVDALAPVTTFYDIFYNQALEKLNNHGSCGVGFAATVERSESPYKLYVQDLMFPEIVKQKLEAIKKYYFQKVNHNDRVGYFYYDNDFDTAEKKYLEDVNNCTKLISIVTEKAFFKTHKNNDFVFEGSQGILLDMDFGFFPNVTRSNTTSKNALEIITRNNLLPPEIYYITRSYQTRHGNGYMSDESLQVNNPLETNVQHEWQGVFRTGNLDTRLIDYAIKCDDNFSHGLKKNLAITCLDQIEINIEQTLSKIYFNFESVIKSYSDCSDNIGKSVSLI